MSGPGGWRRVDTVFADNGVRTVRRYGAAGRNATERHAWRGICVESWSRGSAVTEHMFADGADLLHDPPCRLARQAAGRAAAVVAEPVPVPVPAPEAGRALEALAGQRRLIITWAAARRRVAAGDAERLVADDRALCTVEVSAADLPSCSEVVRWDEADVPGALERVAEAADRVRALASLPAAGPDAPELESGACDLVLDPGYAGAFFHELLGHPLEADIVAGEAGYLSGRLGEQVAPSWLTVTDGPPPPVEGAAASIDDEGTPIGTVELLASGRVAGVLSDVQTAALLGVPSSGHGRRLDYRHPVIPRMWHTSARVAGAAPEPPGPVRLAPRGLRLRWMNLLTGDFEFAIDAATLDTGTGRPRRAGPCSMTGNALTVLAALRPGTAVSRPGGRATKGCGKLGQFPLITTFANSGMWIPSEAVHVRSDPGS